MLTQDENSDVTETSTDETKKTDKPKKSVKSKGTVKNKTVAKGKPVLKKAAKSATNDKAKVKKTATKAAPVEKDQFGFRKGSKKSAAAALYASKKGATLSEVKEKTGSSQLNLLTELKNRKFKVQTTKEKGTGKKQVTRYKIVLPEKAAKPEKATAVKKNGPDKGAEASA